MPDLKWQSFTADELSPRARAAYDKYKDAYRIASDLRKAFEAQMTADAGKLPDGKTLVFGYRFGKISIALGDETSAKSKATAKPLLKDWLASQR